MNKKILIIGLAILIVIIGIVILLSALNKGSLEVKSNPNNIRIVINDKAYQTPLVLKLKSGKYPVHAILNPFYDTYKDAVIERGKTNSLFFDFTATEVKKNEIPITEADSDPLVYNNHFSISGIKADGSYTITLFAVLNAGVNGPSMEEQLAEYQKQLRDYKKEALEWVKGRGADPNNLKINWLPEEAKDL